jgi:hypothetical protein
MKTTDNNIIKQPNVESQSLIQRTRKNARSLLDKLSKGSLSEIGIRGSVYGLAMDNILYGLAHKIPQLTYSTGLKVPGYAEGGIHLDDVIVQSTFAYIILYGIRRKDIKSTVFGITGAIASLWTSQYQLGPL